MSFLDDLPRPFFVLAPMDDVTDTVFRQIITSLYEKTTSGTSHAKEMQGASEARNDAYSEVRGVSTGAGNTVVRRKFVGATSKAGWQDRALGGPDVFFTEFVNVDGLQSPGRQKLLHKLAFTAHEKPLIAQIWGKNPENYYKTVKELADGTLAAESNGLIFGHQNKGLNFAGVDINMGCPDKTICKNGCCAALINNRGLTEEILAASREGAAGKDFPISVKTRVGFNQVDISWLEYLLTQKLNMLSIHGRTAKQMSKDFADWDLIGQARQIRDSLSPTTLIVGNGDILSRAQGLELAKKHQLDGVMIGRGIFEDPFVFANDSPWSQWQPKQRIELYKKHVELFNQTYKHEQRKVVGLNKFCKVYVNGFDGAKELREQLMQSKATDELINIIDKAQKNLN